MRSINFANDQKGIPCRAKRPMRSVNFANARKDIKTQ